jgi:hypothetical protein
MTGSQVSAFTGGAYGVLDYYGAKYQGPLVIQGGVNASPGSGADTGKRSYSVGSSKADVQVTLTDPSGGYEYCTETWIF